MKKLILILLLLTSIVSAKAQFSTHDKHNYSRLNLPSLSDMMLVKQQYPYLHIYGGSNHDVYLGCLNCSKNITNSIWNPYGNYGNHFYIRSIWNKYGSYGDNYSSVSPFNTYAVDPPVVVDKRGNFYGYLTINSRTKDQCTLDVAKIIYEYYETIREDIETFYDNLD